AANHSVGALDGGDAAEGEDAGLSSSAAAFGKNAVADVDGSDRNVGRGDASGRDGGDGGDCAIGIEHGSDGSGTIDDDGAVDSIEEVGVGVVEGVGGNGANADLVDDNAIVARGDDAGGGDVADGFTGAQERDVRKRNADALIDEG